MLELEKNSSKSTSVDDTSPSFTPTSNVRNGFRMSWPENQGILFFYISKTLQMNRISFMASLLNAVL